MISRVEMNPGLCLCQQVQAAGVSAGGNCPTDNEDQRGENLQFRKESRREQHSQHYATCWTSYSKDMHTNSEDIKQSMWVKLIALLNQLSKENIEWISDLPHKRNVEKDH